MTIVTMLMLLLYCNSRCSNSEKGSEKTVHFAQELN